MQEQEEWRPAVGYEGVLEVSSLGRVKRLSYVNKLGWVFQERIIEPSSKKGGYLAVGVKDASGKQKVPRIHALVAAAFIGPRPKGMVVNHKDFDKQNNRVSNLEYVSHRENIQHSARAARHSGVLSMEEVQALRSLVQRDPGIDLQVIADRLGVETQTIRNVLDARTYPLVPNKDGSMPEPLIYTHGKTICLEDIADLQALGFSIPAISMFFGVDYSTPYQMLRRAGIHQEDGHPGTGACLHESRSE